MCKTHLIESIFTKNEFHIPFQSAKYFIIQLPIRGILIHNKFLNMLLQPMSRRKWEYSTWVRRNQQIMGHKRMWAPKCTKGSGPNWLVAFYGIKCNPCTNIKGLFLLANFNKLNENEIGNFDVIFYEFLLLLFSFLFYIRP